MSEALLENFYSKNGFAPVRKESGVVDPGAKSALSLLDKVKRNIEHGRKNPNFTLAEVRDMCRCTVICDSYKDMPERIRELKETFPSLTGYISRYANGYRGVHLNVVVDGVYAEIQLCTSKAYEYGQATEHIYQRWRNFSPENFSRQELEGKIRKGEFEPSEKVKALLEQGQDNDKALIVQLSAEQREQYKETEDLFAELHSDGEFHESERPIEALLLSYSAMEKDIAKIDPQLSKTFPLDKDGKLDVKHATKIIENVQKKNSQVQRKFIRAVEKRAPAKGQEVENERLVSNISAMLAIFDNAYSKKVEQNGLDPNMHLLDYSKNKSLVAIKYGKFCEELGIYHSSINQRQVEDFLTMFESSNSAYLPTKEELSNAIMDSLPKVEKVSVNEIDECREENKDLQVDHSIYIEPSKLTSQQDNENLSESEKKTD